MTTIAVVGLGAMGGGIAGRLLDAGHETIVWNRSPAKSERLVELGATPAGNPAEAARRSEAVITMISDPAALRAVVEGPAGIAAGADRSVTIIEMSTVGPAAVSWLASALPEEAGLLDAPVLGSVSEAGSGDLRIFVGGPAPLFERWAPVLSALGSPIHVGPLGAGASAKLVANSTLLGILGVLGEAIALARGLGLPPDTTFDVLDTTPLAQQAERRRRAVETGEYPARFSLSLARKDAELIAEAAAGAGIDLRLGASTKRWLTDADDAGLGEQDYSAVLAHILETRIPGHESEPPL
jgi:3-hydroxyisobutyrate dehydrogenase-like beta-hydroxyacid dehydrogenase